MELENLLKTLAVVLNTQVTLIRDTVFTPMGIAHRPPKIIYTNEDKTWVILDLESEEKAIQEIKSIIEIKQNAA